MRSNPDGTLDPGPGPTAVLVSGGIDSAVLTAELRERCPSVHPLYVRAGHLWEEAELDHLRRYLDAIRHANLKPLAVLDMPVADLLPGHWSINGCGVPDGNSPDAAVFLPARNILLLSKAMLWCHLAGVGELALGTLLGNPFPDATGGFTDAFARVVCLGLGAPGSIRISRPYAALDKLAVLRRGIGLPLELTFSCLRPVSSHPCDDCNKCTERREALDAFRNGSSRSHVA